MGVDPKFLMKKLQTCNFRAMNHIGFFIYKIPNYSILSAVRLNEFENKGIIILFPGNLLVLSSLYLFDI